MVQCPACKSFSSTDTCSVCAAKQNTGTIDAVICEHTVDSIRDSIERLVNETTYGSHITQTDFNRLVANLTLYTVNTMWSHCDEVVAHYRTIMMKGRTR